jgi:hypothetical protein
MITQRLLSVLSLLAFAAFVGVVLLFAPEPDLIVIVTLVVVIAAYFVVYNDAGSK